jgi:hypothetical protein
MPHPAAPAVQPQYAMGGIMKKFVLALSIAMLALPALAQTSQQDRMKACNADAAKQEMKGEERKAFMKQCLAAKKEDAGSRNAENAEKERKELTPQQAKMKKCNADAKTRELKGEERKSFMKGCLSAG